VHANRGVPHRRRRYLVVAGLLVVIVGALATIKFAQIATLMGFGKQMAAAGPPPEAVGTDVATSAAWEATVTAVGSVAGVQSVVVANEVPGTVLQLHFESGQQVRAGKILVELDAAAERAQLRAAEARRDNAEITAKRSRELVAKEAIPQATLDADASAARAAEADVAAMQAAIDKKLVRAPFAGRLGIRAINRGQYLAPGTTITTLDSTGGAYVDFTLPQEQLGVVHVGMPVRITVRGASKPLTGTVHAVDPTIDAVSRSIRLRADVTEPGAHLLRPGMFVNVAVVLPARRPFVIVPVTAVVHASYGDSIFVVEDKPPGAPGMRITPDFKPVKVVRQQIVRVGPARGDFVAITEGVREGQAVVVAGAFKLRNGSPIVVDNAVKPTASLEPRPENR
jgi:membrane fusion protein (multidrug efflux system)